MLGTTEFPPDERSRIVSGLARLCALRSFVRPDPEELEILLKPRLGFMQAHPVKGANCGFVPKRN